MQNYIKHSQQTVSPVIDPSGAITTDNLKRNKEIIPVKNIPEAM